MLLDINDSEVTINTLLISSIENGKTGSTIRMNNGETYECSHSDADSIMDFSDLESVHRLSNLIEDLIKEKTQ
jgi:hypothetical protein